MRNGREPKLQEEYYLPPCTGEVRVFFKGCHDLSGYYSTKASLSYWNYCGRSDEYNSVIGAYVYLLFFYLHQKKHQKGGWGDGSVVKSAYHASLNWNSDPQKP